MVKGLVDSVEIPFQGLDELQGATLADRFVLDTMIGRGGYGAVFVAEQQSVGRKCAVKVLVPEVLERPRNVRRFEVEARATSQLVHPNTVVIYDFGLDQKRKLLYLAMEYIDGEPLRERMRRDGQLDLESTVWIAHQAAGSLQDAHDRGLVHRDVKPHNIMLTSRGRDDAFVKVIDFGIAKFLDHDSIRETFQRLTATGMIIGTPTYMPPEQVRSQDLDGRADQYALAACVYQMLTGTPMFSGSSAIEIATRQLMERPRPPRELNPAVPQAVQTVILRALEKERDRRYPSIAEFAAALADAANISIASVDSAERRREAARRLPPPAATQDDSPEPQLSATATMTLGATVSTTEPMAVLPRDEPQTAQRTLPAEVKPVPVETPGAPSALVPPFVGIVVLLMVIYGIVILFRTDPPPDPLPTAPVAAAPAAAPEPDLSLAEPVDLGADTRHNPDMGPDAPPAPLIETRPEPVAPPRVTVSITAIPWGTVHVDGKSIGDDRRHKVRLTPGRHTFELRQQGESVTRKTVDVQPGKNTMVELIAP